MSGNCNEKEEEAMHITAQDGVVTTGPDSTASRSSTRTAEDHDDVTAISAVTTPTQQQQQQQLQGKEPPNQPLVPPIQQRKTINQFKAVVSRAVHDSKVAATTTSNTMRKHLTTTTVVKKVSERVVRTMTNNNKRNHSTTDTTSTTTTSMSNGTMGLRLRRKQHLLPTTMMNDSSETTTLDHTGNDDETNIVPPDGTDETTVDGDVLLSSSLPLQLPLQTTHNNKNNNNRKSNGVVTLSPFMEFITADLTLIFVFALFAAFYPLVEHYDILFTTSTTTITEVTTSSAMNIEPTTSTTQQQQQELPTPIFVLTRIALPWMIATFTFGLALGQYVGDDYWHWLLLPTMNDATTTSSSRNADETTTNETGISSSDGTKSDSTVLLQEQPPPQQRDSIKESIGKKHTVFMTLLGSNRSARIRFRNRHATSGGSILTTSTTTLTTATTAVVTDRNITKQLRQQPVKVWTTLTNASKGRMENDADDDNNNSSTKTLSPQQQQQQQQKSRLFPWQRHVTPTMDGYLMQHLLQRDSFRKLIRKADQSTSVVQTPSSSDTTTETLNNSNQSQEIQDEQEHQQQSQHLGSFDLSSSVAETLDGYVVAPVFQLRGMDIFLSGDNIPEMESSTHPYLVEHGLRSVPTFVVNVLTQWGNIFIYFEMPRWVRSFNISENASDPDDVVALKRFLNGDSTYRNDRLKMIPSLVDGPLPIRMLAPPKREKVVNCDWMPIIWNQQDEVRNSDGSILYPILEATLDCMTSRPIRSMAGLVKKYLHLLSIDAAIVIGTPEHQTEMEPSACLGLWRFNHIDISPCPNLPDRYESVEISTKTMITTESQDDDSMVSAADIQRASIAMTGMQTTSL